ncbi:hypothetical protein [uncultured Aquimonas sp.]|mgnify:CR=1 FL=1|uniref:hypothetical protein n=1 Tax=uncultured Aquimonas sp. TaxID=385483 RepID=UPI00086EE592|nr:hypothetical protein [uncultured Aquimonas sp.]ODU48070.1 MAG: hypothetical protein ABS96_01685 [Xanthomonadaceae bacterium SCN 69-123]
MNRPHVSLVGVVLALVLLIGGVSLIAFPRAIVVHHAGNWKVPKSAQAFGRQEVSASTVRLYGFACLPIGLLLLAVSALPLRPGK